MKFSKKQIQFSLAISFVVIVVINLITVITKNRTADPTVTPQQEYSATKIGHFFKLHYKPTIISTILDSVVIFHTPDKGLVAINKLSLKTIWKIEPQEIFFKAKFYADKNYIYILPLDFNTGGYILGLIIKLDAHTGKRTWEKINTGATNIYSSEEIDFFATLNTQEDKHFHFRDKNLGKKFQAIEEINNISHFAHSKEFDWNQAISIDEVFYNPYQKQFIKNTSSLFYKKHKDYLVSVQTDNGVLLKGFQLNKTVPYLTPIDSLFIKGYRPNQSLPPNCIKITDKWIIWKRSLAYKHDFTFLNKSNMQEHHNFDLSTSQEGNLQSWDVNKNGDIVVSLDNKLILLPIESQETITIQYKELETLSYEMDNTNLYIATHYPYPFYILPIENLKKVEHKTILLENSSKAIFRSF